jgi:hypothetical protein
VPNRIVRRIRKESDDANGEEDEAFTESSKQPVYASPILAGILAL